MFRRKKPSTPAAPAVPAEGDAVVRPDASRPGTLHWAADEASAREPTVAPFPSREPRLEPVRSPVSATGPERVQQESAAPMSDKPMPPRPDLARPDSPRPAAPIPPSGQPSPPSRNPLSHLPHIGDPSRRPSGVPGLHGQERARPVVEGRKLIVGRDIVLTGSIAACDTLVVEGRVESDITDASVVEIAANGTFQGSADVDHAEIAGLFEGKLTVHKKLTVARTGRIIGTVRYATIEIEAGGQVQGAMELLTGEAASSTQG